MVAVGKASRNYRRLILGEPLSPVQQVAKQNQFALAARQLEGGRSLFLAIGAGRIKNCGYGGTHSTTSRKVLLQLSATFGIESFQTVFPFSVITKLGSALT